MNNIMNSVKKFMGRRYIITVLMLISLAACNESEPQQKNRITEKESVDILLREAAAEINKRLPAMVDEQTRLDSTYVMGGELRYNFSLVNVLAQQIDAYKFMINMQQQIKTPICKTKQMQLFLNQGYPIVYQYYDKQQSLFTKIIIQQKDC